jgi:hypothetical protein
MPGATWVTNTEDQQIVTQTNWHLGFVHPCQCINVVWPV